MQRNFKNLRRYFSRSSVIDIAPEVKNALNDRKAVVVLESAVITHGLPYPKNVETALDMENIIKSNVIVYRKTILNMFNFFFWTQILGRRARNSGHNQRESQSRYGARTDQRARHVNRKNHRQSF